MRFSISLAVLALLGALLPLGNGGAQESASGERPPGALRVRYSYDGYLGENHGEVANCKGARRNGTVKVNGDLRWDGDMPPGDVSYAGRGKVVFDIDECNLKPVDGGATHDYCTIRISATYDANVTFEVKGVIDDEPREAWLRWKPAGPVTATVTRGDCEESVAAQIRQQLRDGYYFSGQHVSADDEEVLNVMARGGIPRSGTYKDLTTDPSDVGMWTIALNEEENCEADSIALAVARNQVANAARDVNSSFNEMRSLSNLLSGNPQIAPVADFIRSQQTSMTSAFAARSSSPAGRSRDAAEAAYGKAVANVTAQSSVNAGRVAAAQVPATGGAAVDPRIGQLSIAMAKFDAQAQVLAASLTDLENKAKRYEECLRNR